MDLGKIQTYDVPSPRWARRWRFGKVVGIHFGAFSSRRQYIFSERNGTRKASVPRREECPVTGIKSKANFVTANAVDTILAVPRCVGVPPVNYLEKEDYGKVPKYLKQVGVTK